MSGKKHFFYFFKKKTLKKTGFSFHKEAVLEVAPSNVYTIHFLSLEKNNFFGFFKKVIFGLFRAILNFFWYPSKMGVTKIFWIIVTVDKSHCG